MTKNVNSFDEVRGSRNYFPLSNTEFGSHMEAMGTVHCEEAHMRTINKLEVDGGIYKKVLSQWYMQQLFGDESDYDSCTKGGDSAHQNASEISEKDTKAKKSEGWVNRSSIEEGSWKGGV